jgi:FeS assembly protein IscX
MAISWSDVGELGAQLYEENEDVNPLTLSFTKLRDMTMALDEFEGDASGCSEGVLESIQMAWYEEWKLDNE